MAAPEVTLQINVVGIDNVVRAFDTIGNKSAEVATKVNANTNTMDINYKRLALTTAGLIVNSVQLGDIMHRMATGQMDVSRGALMLSMNFLQLTAQLITMDTAYGAVISKKIIAIALGAKEVAIDIAAAAAKAVHTAAVWAHVVAEKARAVASAIAHGISTLGAALPLIIAAAAGAGAIALAATAAIPSRHYGGPIPVTGSYLLEAGEHVLAKESILGTLTSLNNTKSVYIAPGAITILESRTPRETGDAVIDALRRAGVI